MIRRHYRYLCLPDELRERTVFAGNGNRADEVGSQFLLIVTSNYLARKFANYRIFRRIEYAGKYKTLENRIFDFVVTLIPHYPWTAVFSASASCAGLVIEQQKCGRGRKGKLLAGGIHSGFLMNIC